MKKFNFFVRGVMLLAFLISFTGYSQCEYQLEMNDSFGDGWNGANMSVQVNGSNVLTNVSATGSGTTLNFPVNTGDVISTTWGANGQWPGECSFNILDISGSSVGSGFAGTNLSGIIAACTATGYCNSTPNNTDGQGITNLELGASSFPFPVDNPYEDITATAVDAQQGNNLNTQITFATGFYRYNTNIWVDYDGDFVFSPAELVFSGGNGSNGTNVGNQTLNASFMINAALPVGQYRMRIGTADTGQNTPNPCFDGSWGVTIDALLNVIEPVCTGAVVASTAVDPACDTLQYYVDVNLSGLGNVVSIDDSAGGSTTILDSGITRVGPFASYTSVTLSAVHSLVDGNASPCNFDIGTFIYNCPPPNDSCGDAIEVFCNSVETGTTEFATDESLAFCGTSLSTNNGVWYSYAGTGGDIIVSTAGSSYDTKLGVFSGSCGALVCVGGNDDGGPGLTSEVTFSSELGEIYSIYVTGFGTGTNGRGEFTLSIECVCLASIEGDACQNVYSSSFAPLASTDLTAVGQFGLAPYTYAWSDGQTGATISVTPSDTTVYEVTVTDASGCTSTAVTTVLVVDVSCTNGGEQDKVVVCHNGEELCISSNAVQSHLNHGDSIGACFIEVSCETPPLCDSILKVPSPDAVDVSTSVEISWGGATGYVLGYELSVGTTPGGTEVVGPLDVGLDLSFPLSGLDFSTTYYVTVIPYNDNGPATDCGESKSFTTEAAPWCADALSIGCDESLTGNINDGETNDYLSNCFRNTDGVAGVWYTYVGTGDDVIVSTCGTPFDTYLSVYEGDCNSISCNGGDDDNFSCSGFTSSSEYEMPTTIGTNYYFYVTPYSNFTNVGTGVFTISVECVVPPPPPASCTDATTVACGTSVNGNTAGGDVNPFPFCGTTLSTAPGAFYIVEGTGGNITVDTNGSSYDTKLGVFTGSCGALVCVDGDDDGGAGLQSLVTFASVLGTTYYVYVTGFSSASGDFDLNVTCLEAPDPLGGEVTCGTTLVQEYCYGNNEDTGILYTSSNGSPLTLTFNSGNIEASIWDFLKIYDGTNAGAALIYQNPTPYGYNLAGTSVTAPSGSMFVSLISDGSVSCQSGSSSATNWNFDVTCSSAREASPDWSLYPNPATNGEIELDLTNYLNTDLEIQMIDYSGKVLINKAESNLQNPRYRMNTQNASSGLYFVRIVTNSGVSVKKLIINN